MDEEPEESENSCSEGEESSHVTEVAWLHLAYLQMVWEPG